MTRRPLRVTYWSKAMAELYVGLALFLMAAGSLGAFLHAISPEVMVAQAIEKEFPR